MRKYKLQYILSLFLLITGMSGKAQVTDSPYVPTGYKLVFSDEFDDANSKDANWQKHTQNGVVRDWEQFVINGDGDCHLQGTSYTADDGTKKFKNPSALTKRAFKYGYFECRYKYSKSNGINNSFWLVQNASALDMQNLEIDINEGQLDEGGQREFGSVQENLKYDDSVRPQILEWSHNGNPLKSAYWYSSTILGSADINLCDDYHIYAFEWSPTIMNFYCDGKLLLSSPNTVASGPNKGRRWLNYPMPVYLSSMYSSSIPFADQAFDSEMLVDYVRVYQSDDSKDVGVAPPAGGNLIKNGGFGSTESNDYTASHNTGDPQTQYMWSASMGSVKEGYYKCSLTDKRTSPLYMPAQFIKPLPAGTYKLKFRAKITHDATAYMDFKLSDNTNLSSSLITSIKSADGTTTLSSRVNASDCPDWKDYEYRIVVKNNAAAVEDRFMFIQMNPTDSASFCIDDVELTPVKADKVYIHNTADNTSWTNVTTTSDGKIKVVAADKIEDIPSGYNWYFAPGTYTLPVGKSSISNQKMYGGFTGQESTVDETVLSSRKRTDVDGNGLVEKWEFANRVYLQRGESLPATAEDAYLTLLGGSELDGVTIRNINSSNAYALRVGVYISTPAIAVPSSNAGTLRNCIVQNISAPGLVDISDYSDMDGCLIENSTVTSATGVFMPGYQCKMRNTKCRNIDMAGKNVYFVIPKIGMDGATPTIENCIFHNIKTGQYSYGVIRAQGTPVTSNACNIVNCTFSNNSSNNVIEFIGVSGKVVNCLINAKTSSIRSNNSGATVDAYNCVSNKPFSAKASEGTVTNNNCSTSVTIGFNGSVPSTWGNVATGDADYSNVTEATFSLNGFPTDGANSLYGISDADGVTAPTADILGYSQTSANYAIGAYNPLTVLRESSAENAAGIADGTTNVSVNRTLAANQWAALYLPFAMSAAQVTTTFGTGTKVAEYDKVNSTATTLKFKTTASGVAVNTPCIICPTQSITNFNINSAALTKSTTAPTVGNDKFTFVGAYDKTAYSDREVWYVAKDNKVKSLTSGGTLKGLTAHFEKLTAGGAKELDLIIDDDATGIDDVTTGEQSASEAKSYNVLGQQVNGGYRGIVIRNGKKQLIK